MTETSPDTIARDRTATLGSRVRNAASWVLIAQFAQYGLRLGSNLVLTRLLVPEAFGLMALVQSVLTGLELFSDTGVRVSVVQNERGDEPEFLDTAWTVQAARGWLLAGATALVAWPFASFYEQPELGPLVAVCGLSLAIRGHQSMGLFRLERQLKHGKLAALELGARVAATCVTIALVWWQRSVWGLAMGQLVAVLIPMLVSHAIAESPRHRPRWDSESGRSLYRFGRWLFITTPFAFVANHGDRLFLGRYVSVEELGIFSIGVLLALAVRDMSGRISGRVLLPVYSQIHREEPETLRRRVAKLRLALFATFLPPLWILAGCGDLVIGLLYDDRYASAGRVCQIVAGAMILPVIGRVGPVFLAKGQSWVGLVIAAVPAAVVAIGIPLGFAWGGFDGAVWGFAASLAIRYPLNVGIALSYRLWMPLYDALGLLASAAAVGGMLWARGLSPWG